MSTLWPPRADTTRSQQWRAISDLLQELEEEEQRWRHRDAPPAQWAVKREECQGWLPYPLAQFVTYLTDAIRATPGPRFLDVGCGPGTKLRIARMLFGLQAAGVDISPEMIAEGKRQGLAVVIADARTWGGYRDADIIYINRPIVPPAGFEHRLMSHMRPGAVLISVNGATRPSDLGWDIVAEEFGTGPVCGVWSKPVKIRRHQTPPSPPATAVPRPVHDVPLPAETP
jgi:SAM-dependent methyltransferase